MIGRLTGTVLSRAPGRVLLDVGGVGYDVQIPLGTFYELARASSGNVSLHVHTHVREDALQLFGFSSLDERRLFEQLIAISGVGPRLALAILSGIGVDELHQSVARQDRARLQRIPGIGKKTAERLLLELKDRLGVGETDRPGAGGSSAAEETGMRSDAVSALVNLGYTREVAASAVERVLRSSDDDITLEGTLRGALAGLVRK